MSNVGEVSARLMWIKAKFRGEIWVFVCTQGPGSEKRGKPFGVNCHNVLERGKGVVE